MWALVALVVGVLVALAAVVPVKWAKMVGGRLWLATVDNRRWQPQLPVVPMPARTAPTTTMATQAIPRIIHQTHEHADVPVGMRRAMQSLIDANPEYEHRYYDGEACRRVLELFPATVRLAYAMLIPGAYRADLFRQCVTYVYGGVYADTGFVALRPLRDAIAAADTFVCPVDVYRKGIGQGLQIAFIATTARNPVSLASIREIVRNVLGRAYRGDPLDITGPLVMGRMYNKVRGADQQARIPAAAVGGRFGHGPRRDSGQITLRGLPVFDTKYPGYYDDLSRYVPGKARYSVHWHARRVYRTAADLLFVHIPKTGGSSLKDWLATNIGASTHNLVGPRRGPCSAYHTPAAYDRPGLRRRVRFAVIRKPADRFVSEYHWHTRVRKKSLPPLNTWARLTLDRLELDNAWTGHDCHLLPQTEYAKHCDVLICFDRLGDEFRALLRCLGYTRPVELPRKNDGNSSDAEVLHSGLVVRLERFYAADCALYARVSGDTSLLVSAGQYK